MNTSIYNKEIALNNLMGSEEMLSEVIDCFLTNSIDDSSLQFIRDATGSKNIAALYRKLHNLKTTSLYAGAELLNESCLRLFNLCKELISEILQNISPNISSAQHIDINPYLKTIAEEIIELKKSSESISALLTAGKSAELIAAIADEFKKMDDSGRLSQLVPLTENIIEQSLLFRNLFTNSQN